MRLFSSFGCKITVADLDVDRMNTLKQEPSLSGDNIIWIACDVSVENDVKEAMDKTVQKWGTIHVALASAGIATPMMTLTSKSSLNTKAFRKLMDVNVMGSIYVAKYASVAMSKNQPLNERGEKGVIMFVSSVAAEEGQRSQVGYSASKGAMNGVVLPMARDLGRYGIRAVTIAPGVFATPIGKKTTQNEALIHALEKMSPMGRFGQPDEFALFVKMIVENGYLNGVRLRVDGATRIAHL